MGPALKLALARARRRPGRWLLTVLGIALATAFSGAVAAESTIAGAESARSALASLPSAGRAVSVTWPGPVTPAVRSEAHTLLDGLGLPDQTEVVLLSAVRLSDQLVRPAAIAPLSRWTGASDPGPCRPADCPMLTTDVPASTGALTAYDVRLTPAGHAELTSAAPLGFLPTPGSGVPPVWLTGDPEGLDALPGLSGTYRTHTWLSIEPPAKLYAWDLAQLEQRLQRAQAALQSSGSQFALTAPFAALDAARSINAAAPRRLLLTGGGALAALALFVVLAAGGLRREQSLELARLRQAGARTGQCLTLAGAEAALMCGIGVALGALGAVLAGSVLAHAASLPAGAVLDHSLLTGGGLAGALGGWLGATALVCALTLATNPRIVDVLALASAAALVLALTRSGGGDDPLPVLLAPLCCLTAGVIVFRLTGVLLQAGERAFRRGPVLARVAFVGLARAPAAPALAIAFVAVSTGLGGFALTYRATLVRGAADEAAAQVPADAIVSPGEDFTPPLALAPLSRWRQLAGGSVLPVRRTFASFPSGASTATVPALGIPATALPMLHGWRSGQGSASIATLARRLEPAGAVRVPGPMLPSGATTLTLTAASPDLDIGITADLRDAAGFVHPLSLGTAGPHATRLSARLPAGRWELEAFTLTESSGLEASNGHQNGENPAAATQFTARLSLGPALALAAGHARLAELSLSAWVGTGAASGDVGRVRFAESGAPGVVRPAQPSDFNPLPVITDPDTASQATASGMLPLTVDGEPVRARVIGTLARFPTVEGGGTGFVVADEATLAAALDAQLPGQGRPDELWIATRHLEAMTSALTRGAFAQLSVAYRSTIERRLRGAPIARGVLGTLIAAAALAIALAVLGLLVALLGPSRDERIERDLAAQGAGPRWLRQELRVRMLLAAAVGVVVGTGLAALLTRLAVQTVRAAGVLADPEPPLVAVAPWTQLGLWALAALAALSLASLAATATARSR